VDNRLNLEEYLRGFHSPLEKRRVFYAIFEEMHRYHNNGCYIKNLSFQTISLCFTNPTDIKFPYYEKIGKYNLSDVVELKRQNIVNLSILMISAFLDYTDKIVVLNYEVIKNEFNKFKDIIYLEDYQYFEKVFVNEEFVYYDDYIRNKNVNNPKPFVEKMKVSENEEAFTTSLLLTINLVVVVMVLSCIILYLS